MVLLSYLVAGACFYWVFHDVRWNELLQSMAHIELWRLGAAAALDIASYLLVAWEWQLLLRPVGALGFREATRAVFAGRFANDVLPVQLGYLVRIYLASRALGQRFSCVVPSLLIERLLDGGWLGLGILLLTFFVSLPPAVARARDILGTIVLAGVTTLLVLALRQRKPQAESPGARTNGTNALRAVTAFLTRVMAGIRSIGRSHLLPAVIVLSAIKLVVQGLAYCAVLWAYGLHVSVWTGLGIFLIAYLGITVPSTPASAGVFQFCSVMGLELFGIQKTTASGVSLVAFVVLTAPLAAAGFYAVASSGMKWSELRKELITLKERMEGEG